MTLSLSVSGVGAPARSGEVETDPVPLPHSVTNGLVFCVQCVRCAVFYLDCGFKRE